MIMLMFIEHNFFRRYYLSIQNTFPIYYYCIYYVCLKWYC